MAEETTMFERTDREIELMERHIQMLKVTKANEPVGIIRLSEILGIPKHKVRYSLRLLEQDGLITATNEGARVTDKYDGFMTELDTYLVKLTSKIADVRDEIPK